MADPLMRTLLAIGVALAGAAHAAQPEDPTRPPSAASRVSAAAPDLGADALVLQSVLLGPDRKVAVVSGLPVAVGGEVLGHRLLSVTDSAAVLQGPNGIVTLHLYPGVERSVVKFARSGPMKMASSRRKSRQ